MINVTNISRSTTTGYLMMVYVLMFVFSSAIGLKSLSLLLKPTKNPSYLTIAYIVLGWAAIELLFSWLLNVFYMGRNGSWDSVIPFMSLTPIIMQTPLRFLSRMFGYFGTSAVVGTGLVLLFASIRNTKWRRPTTTYWFALILLNILLWIVYASANGPTIRTIIASETLVQNQTINATNTDLVFLPEYGRDDYDNNNIKSRFNTQGHQVYYTGTRQSTKNYNNSNVLIYGSTKKGFTYEHKKSRLIVGGEYLPLTAETAVRTLTSDVYTDFTVRRAVTKGDSFPGPYRLPNGVVVGNAACSSIISPDDYRKLSSQGATLPGNCASLKIFNGSRLFAIFHDGLAKFVATSNARPFLQSANSWKAFALDHNGNTIARTDPVSQMNVTVKTNTKITPYTVLGEWLSCHGIVFLFVSNARKRLNKKH